MEANKERPFLLNYWMFSVHAPFDAKAALIEKYRSKTDPNDPQHSPTYAAMIESMDDAVGTLLDAIDRLGIADNTIIVFYSDNGGNMYDQIDGTTPTSNTPLRGGKATPWEGGVRVPCVVAWPDLVKAESRSDALIQGADFYPTFVEALGLKTSPDKHFDGVSILPALKGGSLDREAIFSYFPHAPPIPAWLPPSVTVWSGDWKLIRLFHQGENRAHQWRLYNLEDDIGEQNDLSAKEQIKVKQLDRLIENFLNDTKAVRPVPNPNFNPAAYKPELEGVDNRPKAKKAKPKKAPAKK